MLGEAGSFQSFTLTHTAGDFGIDDTGGGTFIVEAVAQAPIERIEVRNDLETLEEYRLFTDDDLGSRDAGDDAQLVQASNTLSPAAAGREMARKMIPTEEDLAGKAMAALIEYCEAGILGPMVTGARPTTAEPQGARPGKGLLLVCRPCDDERRARRFTRSDPAGVREVAPGVADAPPTDSHAARNSRAAVESSIRTAPRSAPPGGAAIWCRQGGRS